MGATKEPEDIQPLQRFRSPFDRLIVTIETQHDEATGARFVLWRHIQRTFDNVNLVRAGDTAVQFMVDNTFEDLSPLRIKHYPDVVLEVILKEERFLKSPFQTFAKQVDDDYIYYGSMICLRHLATGSYLSTSSGYYTHDSLEHEVHCSQTEEPSREDWWQVVAPYNSENGQNDLLGQRVQYGGRFRLFHMVQHHWLHCHNSETPNMRHYRATGYGGANYSNSEDNWTVSLVKSEGNDWKSGSTVSLCNEGNKRYLHSCLTAFGKDKSVTGYGESNHNCIWRAYIG